MGEKRIETLELIAKDINTNFGNPRKISAKKKKELKQSLETYGDFGIFLIDENNKFNLLSSFYFIYYTFRSFKYNLYFVI